MTLELPERAEMSAMLDDVTRVHFSISSKWMFSSQYNVDNNRRKLTKTGLREVGCRLERRRANKAR